MAALNSLTCDKTYSKQTVAIAPRATGYFTLGGLGCEQRGQVEMTDRTVWGAAPIRTLPRIRCMSGRRAVIRRSRCHSRSHSQSRSHVSLGRGGRGISSVSKWNLSASLWKSANALFVMDQSRQRLA